MSNVVTFAGEQVEAEVFDTKHHNSDHGGGTTFRLKLSRKTKIRPRWFVDLFLSEDLNLLGLNRPSGYAVEPVLRNALTRAFDSGELSFDQMSDTEVRTLRVDETDFDGPERTAG
jgi:hypothetical protein